MYNQAQLSDQVPDQVGKTFTLANNCLHSNPGKHHITCTHDET